MSSFRVPGSSEPVREDSDSHASSRTSEADPSLSAVPQHPHSSGRPAVDPLAAASSPRHELASVKHPVIPRQSQRATNGTDDTLESDTKRKSIGSKLLSKFRHHSSDDKHEHIPSSAPRSQVASGSQTPSRSPWASETKKPFRPENLEQALATEQHRRSKSKQASFGSIDGIRQRKIFGSRRSKVPFQDSDIESHDEHSEPEAAPHYLSSQPANLDLVRSDATRHFPGGLYDVSRDTPPEDPRRSQATSAPLHAPTSLEDPDLDVFAPVGDGGDGHDDLFLADDHQDYDSDGSDDTIAHLIREADGYDSLRFNTKGEVAAGLDYDLLHAAREKERSLSENKDAQSGFSAYSGGASKALSQPLLELEDIELETFLQNFARHTREVTVTRPSGNQKYRMPKWSDFRVSPNDESAAVPDRKRPSMLTRVDRGLHHLSESLEASSIAKAGAKLTGEGRTPSGTGSVPRSRSADDDLDTALHSQPSHTSSPNKKKDKSKKLNKQHSSKGKASSAYTVDEEEDEDWDLVVPSSGDDARHAMSLRDELRVNAEDEGVDGVAFCIAYILALVEKLAPEEIDHHPDRGYREGLIRSHLERLYTIAPFWENLAFRLRRLYRWEDPKTTAAAAMIYFVLWYTNMIPTAFILTIMFYIMRFKYFPPSESYLHEKVMMRMARGKAANTLSEKLRRRSRLDILNIYKRWIVTFGAPTQEAMGLVADFHEKVKNLILWRNSAATRRTLILFGVLNLFVTFAPSQYVSKAIFFFLGITFFCLLPLQSYFPSHRKALSPLWWATFGAPTDAQFAVQLLRKRHLDIDRFAGQLSTAEDVRRAVRSPGASKLKPRPDRREEGIAYGDIEDPSRASFDYVETTKDATLKPRKLGSFFCQYKGLPGRLHVNTKYLYFTPLHSPSLKRGRTPVVAIESLIKTKSIRLMVWSSLGLKIVRNNGKAPLLLANVQHRDEAFNLILAVSTNGK